MLEQLVESRSDRKAGSGRRGAVVLTSGLVMTLLSMVFVWSIMAMDLSLTGSDDLELSSLVAPVPAAAEPPKPEPVQPKEQQQQQSAKSELPTRRDNIARTDEPTLVPEQTSVAKNTSMARPRSGAYRIGPNDSNGTGGGPERGGGPGGAQDYTVPGGTSKIDDEKKEDDPPEMKVPEKKKVTMIHSSIINGKAISLPKPAYSAAAIAVNAGGEVNVQVVLDEEGNVISAKAVSGHVMLKPAAEQAARKAKFSPTKLNDQPVKVTGLIVYRFTRN